MSAAFGEIREFAQESGPVIELKVFGDEFYARLETTDGFTCLYDADLGLYCYATLRSGHFTSTSIPTSAPPPLNAPPHLKEPPDVRNKLFDDRFSNLGFSQPDGEGEAGFEIYGPNNGLLLGRQLNKGKVCGLAILVDFQDVQTNITNSEVSALLNDDAYTANGNYCSVKEYFQLMSSGKLTYTNVVVGPIRLSQNRRYYVDHLLVQEALNLVSNSGIDFKQFDSRGNKVIDAISFLYAGETIWEGSLWPHNSSVLWQSGGYRAGTYQITGLGRSSSDLTIGTFCHESGHMLCRFPDLYDYGKSDGDFESSAGMGFYCLMSAGNHLHGGHTPAPICDYLRYLAGWCPNQISLNIPGSYQATHGTYDTVLLYETNRPNEFFLLENRSQFDLDQYLPSSGLAVYHCDIKGSNERQAGTAQRHYQCSLLQADGKLDLEKNANQGDRNDLFTLFKGEALSDSTIPSTKMWNGSDSGLRIAEISTSGKTITFLVPPRRISMNDNGSSTEADPDAIKRMQEQAKLIQANLDFFKLTQQQEQEKLKAEIERLKLEADKQKAEADKIKALLPTGTTKPLSGATTTDDKFGYLARLAVQHAVKQAAQMIAASVRKACEQVNPARILLVDTLDFCGDDFQALQISMQMEALKEAVTAQAKEIEELLEQIKPVEPGGEELFIPGAGVLPALSQVLAGTPGMISWAADIAAYFQAEDTYKSVDVTVPLTALQTCVVNALKGEPAVELCFPDFHMFGSLDNLPVLQKLRDCAEARRALSAQAAQLKNRIDILQGTVEDKLPPETTAKLKLAEAAYAISQSLIEAFDDFSKLITAVPKGKSYSPLARVAMREYLKKSLGVTHLLYLNVVSSGGELSIRKFLWFFHGIVFLGGCVVTYTLADLEGKTLAADTVSRLSQTRYKRGQKPPIQFEDLTR